MPTSTESTPKARAQEFRIHGMDCAEEVAILKREIGPMAGGPDKLLFDILNGKMTVPSDIDSNAVLTAVGRTGMRAELWETDSPKAARDTFWQRRGRTILTTVSGAATGGGFLLHVLMAGGVLAALGSEGMGLSTQVPAAVKLAYSIAIIAGAWYVIPKAWYSLIRLRPDMNLLMTLAVIGAVAIGEWFEGAVVSFLFALSLTLESWSVGRARRAVEALMAIAPPTVRRIRADGTTEEVPPAVVLVGDKFSVLPGERIPLDGTVLRGASDVNQAPITGESVPVPKEPGVQVFAGTVNGDGALEVEATKLAGETTLAQIIRMVGEAQSRRAPSEQWVDKFARYYTPAVLALAILIAILPPLIVGGPWSDWLYRALVLLVIGCPCALVISTPVSIVAGLAAAAKNGVLIKGGVHLESPAGLKAIALDKTGTLTEGRPRVVEIVPMNGHTEIELLERVAAMEAHSDHPLARAIVEHVRANNVTPLSASEFKIIQGKGATARIDGKAFWLGSHRYLEERNQETPEVHDMLERLSATGRTVVVVGNDEHVCGFIALADTIRPGVANTLKELRNAGIEHLIMLTGDNKGTATAIAREAGLDEIQAELLPADKVTTVEALVRKYKAVAMIGDGVNDAPAMGRASLGIAMGAAGSDTAIEAADIALMSDDLPKLPWLIRHSRRTLSIVRQNIALSLGVKAVFVVLTLLGHASLWTAIAADMGVSLVVIANALRLLRATSD